MWSDHLCDPKDQQIAAEVGYYHGIWDNCRKVCRFQNGGLQKQLEFHLNGLHAAVDAEKQPYK